MSGLLVMRAASASRPALAASVSPATVSRTGSSGTTGTATASAVGGIAPYTYFWKIASPLAPTTPAAASTAFAGVVVGGELPLFELASVTVTDALGSTATASCVVDINAAVGAGGSN